MKIIQVLFFCFLSLTHSVFAFEKNNIEEYLDNMLGYSVKTEDQNKSIESVVYELEKQTENNNEDPYLWYLKGRSSISMIRVNRENNDVDKEFRKLVSIEYEKALSLNKIRNKLTEQQLYNIYTLAYSNSISVEAARQYISLKQKKTTLDKKEHLRILRERIISLLIKQGKFDEALKELNYIDEHFPENAQGDTGNIVWRQYYEKEIETQKSKLAASEEPEKEKTTEPTEPKKPEPVVTAPRQQPSVKIKEPLRKEEVLPETNNNQVIIVGVAIVILILIGFIVARRRK